MYRVNFLAHLAQSCNTRMEGKSSIISISAHERDHVHRAGKAREKQEASVFNLAKFLSERTFHGEGESVKERMYQLSTLSIMWSRTSD